MRTLHKISLFFVFTVLALIQSFTVFAVTTGTVEMRQYNGTGWVPVQVAPLNNGNLTMSNSGVLAFTAGAATTSLNISGTGGNGYIDFAQQSAKPSPNGVNPRLYAGLNGNLGFTSSSGSAAAALLSTNGLSGTDRIYTFPDAAGTFLLQTNPANVSVTNLDAVTSTALHNLLLNAGSSGASITLGQGANGSVTLSPVGTGHVQLGSISAASSDPYFVLSRAIDNTVSGDTRGFLEQSLLTRTGGVSFASYDASPTLSPNADMGHYVSYQSAFTMNLQGGHALNAVYGHYDSFHATAGSTSFTYGFYFDTPTGSGWGTKYSFYNNDSGASQYFAGPTILAGAISPTGGNGLIGITGGSGAAAGYNFLALNNITSSFSTTCGIFGNSAGDANLYLAVPSGKNINQWIGGTPIIDVSASGMAVLQGSISIVSGANASAGTVTLVAGTATITSSAITANSVIIFSEKTAGGTPGIYQPLATVSAGSAIVTSAVTDTSTYNWIALSVN